PYGLQVAVPAMLVAHLFGASLVEGIITGLGFAYLQQHHAEYLVSMRTVVAGERSVETGQARSRPVWQLVAGGLVLLAVVLLVAGWITGGGQLSNAFGADWASVDWSSVVAMIGMMAVLGLVLVPLAWFGLPRAIRGIGAAYVALAVVTPLGLIAPGMAFGEGSPSDVQNQFGYVPRGLQDQSGFFSAPFKDYNVPLPFFIGEDVPMWHTAIGYEIAGLIGMLLLGGILWGVGTLVVRRRARPDVPQRQRGHIGWLEHSIGGVAASIEHAVFTEELARRHGWLQRVDPRAKVAMFLIAVIAASASTSLGVLIGLYAVILVVARASQLPFDFFVKRVWLGIPLFAGIVIVPSIFFAPGPPLLEVGLGPVQVGFSAAGLWSALVFVARVGVSVSLAVLLVLTTPWADVLKSLHALRVPRVFVLVLSMTYRYIFLFLHTLNGMFEARKSRVVARLGGGEDRRWITRSMGALTSRSFKMSNDVYAAMLARGFTGEIRTYSTYRMQATDWQALFGTLVVAALSVPVGRWLA
ncbi:MAG TPA: cobalt ECF transporter T component CbiQ, partial [Chloroflexota bacterium]